jgi:hypothetical protein
VHDESWQCLSALIVKPSSQPRGQQGVRLFGRVVWTAWHVLFGLQLLMFMVPAPQADVFVKPSFAKPMHSGLASARGLS